MPDVRKLVPVGNEPKASQLGWPPQNGGTKSEEAGSSGPEKGTRGLGNARPRLIGVKPVTVS